MSIYFIEQALDSKLEVLNDSFNYYGINNPHKSFYTQKYTQKFQQLDLSLLKNKKEFYLSFADFLSKELLLDNVFKRNETNVFEYLSNKAKHWELIDKKVDMNLDNRNLYLIKKFIIDSVNGLITEEIFYRKIKNFYKLLIEKTTPEEDASHCIDYFIYINDVKIGIQVKPKSFFYGLKKGTTLNSLNKIISAAEKYNNIIFLVYLDKNKIYFAIRDKKEDRCNIITEEVFFKILDLNLTKSQLMSLANESFAKIIKKIKFL